MSDPTAVMLAGIDQDRIDVKPRLILGPHVFVRCDGGYFLSIVGEVDVAAMVGRPDPLAPLPLMPGEVEIGLLRQDRHELLAEPLRHLPFDVAATICGLAVAGNIDAFRPLYAEEER